MSNGKICVSVCAKTADELIEQIRRAEEFADVIEVRFDCLSENEVSSAWERLPAIKKQYLITFRPKEQGGKCETTLVKRIKFWEHALWKLKGTDFLVDYEYDIDFPLKLNPNRTIISMHDFKGVMEDLPFQYELFSELTGKMLKIAVFANDITDSIPVWKLLERAKSENKQIIPIAMGEAGKWTRILGLAHGAFMTYASLESGSETAPGQISAKDLIDVYRVKELDENTAVYGIIGGNTSYSVSPYMHNAAFKACNLNSVYVPLQVKNLDEFIRRMVTRENREIELNFAGFSVTIPHKKAIIQHLDFIDETPHEIGAVNTVKIENGKLYGFNTDAHGFMEPLKKIFGDIKGSRVAVFGAGGAARACIYALKQQGAEVTLFARDPQKGKTLSDKLDISFHELTTDNRQPTTAPDIIVNATPLGMKGALESESILTVEQFSGVKLVYDLVYNPQETRLIKEAKKANVPTIGGIEMLIAQGAKQFEIWTGKDAPLEEMDSTVRNSLQS